MKAGTFAALWVLAAAGFIASLGLAYVAGSWALWGVGGQLGALKIPPYAWAVFVSVLLSLAIGLRARQTKSRSAWPPILIAVSAPLLLLIGNLVG